MLCSEQQRVQQLKTVFYNFYLEKPFVQRLMRDLEMSEKEEKKEHEKGDEKRFG